MLKRLIEVALPLKEVSEHSARERRNGHISNLHIWWARRPLAACRAVVFASLIPDPDDPECPKTFSTLVNELLGGAEFKPKNADGSTIKDTPSNRCLEFIKQLTRWENTNNAHYIEPARKLIAAAHKILHPKAEGDTPKVLDPFAGGGAIPLEALRLGCEAHAIDINPVAHLIELCTLVYPQTYTPSGSPPPYIKQAIDRSHANRAKGGASLFDSQQPADTKTRSQIIPDVELSESTYGKSPLATELRYWGRWVLKSVQAEIGKVFPPDSTGAIPIAHFWARTLECPNPACRASIPLLQQLWLCKKPKRRIALRVIAKGPEKECQFEIVEGREMDFDPRKGTIQLGKAKCPFCETAIGNDDLRRKGMTQTFAERLIAVVTLTPGKKGKTYRLANEADLRAFTEAAHLVRRHSSELPYESITPDRPSPNSRGLSAVVRYGLSTFDTLFNARQALSLICFTKAIKAACGEMRGLGVPEPAAVALSTLMSVALSSNANFLSKICRWQNNWEVVTSTFSRQALAMVWDYAEMNSVTSGEGWPKIIDWIAEMIEKLPMKPGVVHRGSATQLPFHDAECHAIITDPPYYDAVPYGDLSDFFYVWLKRAVGKEHSEVFRTPLTPKAQELIAYYGPGNRKVQKPPEWYEKEMSLAFAEMRRVVNPSGIGCVMFAHKTTAAWEKMIAALLSARLIVTASWPLRTEKTTRAVAKNAAALASSVTLVCRRRADNAQDGLWDDVRKELKEVANERL
jgi:putative DNA methylase